LKLTTEGQELLDNAGWTDDNPLSESGLPLLGIVAAGRPIEAFENTDNLSLNSQFGTGDDIFALEVRGDSMINESITEGDYVICRKTATAQNGQLVIAEIDDGEVTLKRFYRESSLVRLQPANDNYKPIYTDKCKIKAVVLGLLRKF
jgi:repressor LexA